VSRTSNLGITCIFWHQKYKYFICLNAHINVYNIQIVYLMKYLKYISVDYYMIILKFIPWKSESFILLHGFGHISKTVPLETKLPVLRESVNLASAIASEFISLDYHISSQSTEFHLKSVEVNMISSLPCVNLYRPNWLFV